MAVDFSRVRLGRLPHDPARVADINPHILAAGAPAPNEFSVSGVTWTPSLVQNDTLPTCTIAGLMNSARIWALRHGFDLVNTDSRLLAFFAQIAGCADTTAAIAATDGLVLLDVIDRATSGGFDVGEQAPLVPRARTIDFSNMTAIKDAIITTGSAYVGVTLYQSDMQQGAHWQGGLQNAGPSVGGHCIALYGYTSSGFSAATWGETMIADEAWLKSRLDEAYSLAWTFSV